MTLTDSISDKIAESTAAAHSAATTLNPDCMGGLSAHFLFDRSMKVLGRDEGAAWLADTSWSGVRIHNGTLEITPQSANAQLRSLVWGDRNCASMAVEIELAHPRLRAEYTTLAEGCRWRSTGLLRVVSAGRSSNYIAIAMRLGLSPAEAGLIAALCSTSSLAQHAEQRKVCVQTVRAQMKSVLRKLGVHTQLEAVRLLLRVAGGAC